MFNTERSTLFIQSSPIDLLSDMTILINSRLFDFGLLHSSGKWSPPLISSAIEELKMTCVDGYVPQSKWMEMTTGKMNLQEALCFWSVFSSIINPSASPQSDVIKLRELGLMLFCQGYVNTRTRAESFHRTEILAQSLITPAFPSNTGGLLHSPRALTRQTTHNMQKLARDSEQIVQYIKDNISLLLGVVTLDLVPDEDIDITRDSMEVLTLLFHTNSRRALLQELLGEESSIRASTLSSRLLEGVAWPDSTHPSWDLQSPACDTYLESENHSTLQIVNKSKGVLVRCDAKPAEDVFIINCSETAIYIGDPVRNVYIFGCTQSEVVCMAATGTVVVTHSDKLVLRCVTNSLRLDNAMDCQIFAHTSRPPLLSGDTRGIELGPFNVLFSKHADLMRSHFASAEKGSRVGYWSQPICATLSAEPYVLLPPRRFSFSHFPEFSKSESLSLEVALPEIYVDAVTQRTNQIAEMRAQIAAIGDPSVKSKVNAIISGHFREWVSSQHKPRDISELLKAARQSAISETNAK